MFERRQFLGMDRDTGAGSRDDGRRAVVGGKPLLRGVAGRPRVLILDVHARSMLATTGGVFLRRGAGVESAASPVVADVADSRRVDSRVVDIMKNPSVHVIQGRVIEEVPSVPTPALVTVTEVPVAIVDSSVETNGCAPVAFIEGESAATPAPVSGSPKETDVGRHHPGARYPVVVAVPSPIAGRPDVAVAGTGGLLVSGQFRWRDCYGSGDLRERWRRQKERRHRAQQRTGDSDMHRISSRSAPMSGLD